MEDSEAFCSWRSRCARDPSILQPQQPKSRTILGAIPAKPRSCKLSANGCFRGESCQSGHDRDYRKPGMASVIAKKILVSGLPHFFDSEGLYCFFEQKFGSVLDAVVLPLHSDDQAGRFGVVSFKNEDAVHAAVQAKIVYVSGRKAMIDVVYARAAKDVPPSEGKLFGEDDLDQSPPISLVNSASLPPWAQKFRDWLPVFLIEVSKRLEEGEGYPLCSLKGDFRATCGLEIDHVALGFEKLSDFIRAWPEICEPSVVPVGQGAATHIVLKSVPPRLTTSKSEQPHTTLSQSRSQRMPQALPSYISQGSLFSRNIFLDNAENTDLENIPPAILDNVEKLLDEPEKTVNDCGSRVVCRLCKDGEMLARWFAIPCGHLVLCDRCKTSVDKCDQSWRVPCLACCQPVEKWIT